MQLVHQGKPWDTAYTVLTASAVKDHSPASNLATQVVQEENPRAPKTELSETNTRIETIRCQLHAGPGTAAEEAVSVVPMAFFTTFLAAMAFIAFIAFIAKALKRSDVITHKF